jgi:hypothetical protein
MNFSRFSSFLPFIVQIEPSDDIAFSVISSSTQVIVIPEYREQAIVQPELTSTLPSDTHTESSKSIKSLVRSIGTLVCSSLPNAPILTEKKSISKLALVPGRHRRLYRVEIDETTSINPTIARINRSDWSSDDDDGTGWPNIFVAKVTVYRSSKEIKFLTSESSTSTLPEHIPTIYFLLIQLTNDNICRKNHIKLNSLFASINCIRPTDKLIVCNKTRRPKNQTRIEFISNQWYGPTLLLQHYFHLWIRQSLNNDQPILLTHGCFIQLNNSLLFFRIDSIQISSLVIYSIHLTSNEEPPMNDSPIYIAVNEETMGQHTIAFEEKKEWKFDEIETFRSTPIVENFLHQPDQSL